MYVLAIYTIVIFLIVWMIYLFAKTVVYKSIFSPEEVVARDPSSYKLPFEDVCIESKGKVMLHGWYVFHCAPVATVLFFHGNVGNISDRVDEIYLLHEHVAVDVLIIDYRGYGKSEGRPTERGLYNDALAAYDYLVNDRKIAPEKIVGVGHSLGGAVAIYLARRRKIGALIVVSTFSNINDLISLFFPGAMATVLRLLNPVRMPSLYRVGKLSCPILVIHGAQDVIIPCTLGKKLYDAAPNPKMWYNIPGANHNNTFIKGGSKYWYLVKAFVDKTIGDIKS